LDQRIAKVESWGGKPLLVLGLTPQWAALTSAGSGEWGPGSASPPASMNTWRAYVKAVVARYGSRIGAYEVWNEANLQTFWTGTAQQMADMTTIASQEIGGTALVLAPSVTTRLASGRNFTKEFVTALGASGVNNFGGFTLHTYPAGNAGPSPDDACAARAAGIIEWQKKLVDTVGSNSPYLTKQVWDTEVNYGLAGPGSASHTDWTDPAGSVLLDCTYVDSRYLGIDVTFWYEYTASPFSLLGVQFTPSSRFIGAAWNGLAAKVASSSRNAWIPSLGGSAAAPASPDTPSVDPVAPVAPVDIPAASAPAAGDSTTVIGNTIVHCPTASGDSVTVAACPQAAADTQCKSGSFLPTPRIGSLVVPDYATSIIQSQLTASYAITEAVIAAEDLAGPIVEASRDPQGGLFELPLAAFPELVNVETGLPASVLGTLPQNPPPFAPTCKSLTLHAARSAALAKAKAVKGVDVAAGNTLQFVVDGLAPNSSVSAYLDSGSKPLGSLLTNSRGRLIAGARIPAVTAAGSHVLQVVGKATDGRTLAMFTGITVHKPTPLVLKGTAALAASGSKLSSKAVASLKTVQRKIPITAPNTCTISSTFKGNSRRAVTAQTALIKQSMVKYGLTCKVSIKAGSANRAGVQINSKK
jgi:hypothetical protein